MVLSCTENHAVVRMRGIFSIICAGSTTLGWSGRMCTKVHQNLEESHQGTSVSLKILQITLLMEKHFCRNLPALVRGVRLCSGVRITMVPPTFDCTTDFIFLPPLTPYPCQCVVFLSIQECEQLKAQKITHKYTKARKHKGNCIINSGSGLELEQCFW